MIKTFKDFKDLKFMEWFGDSKIVDEKGKPKILYHGTRRDFNVFDPKEIGSGSGNLGHYGYGIYFSDDIREAKIYGDNIKRCFLKIEKPFYSTDENLIELKKNGVHWIDELVPLYVKYDSLYKEVEKVDKVALKLLDLLNKHGYSVITSIK